MRIALKSLAPVQSDYQQAKDCFLADFGYFQVEGIPYALCSDEVFAKASSFTNNSNGLMRQATYL